MTEIPDRATVQTAIDQLITARPRLPIRHHHTLRTIVAAARLWANQPVEEVCGYTYPDGGICGSAKPKDHTAGDHPYQPVTITRPPEIP